MTKEVSSARIIIRLVVSFLLLGAVMFGTAGTLKWLQAWVYLFIAFFFIISGVAWMKKKDPRLLRDRMGMDKKKSVKPVDRVILLFYSIFVFVLLVLPGLDAVRFGWSKPPVYLSVVGFVLLLAANIMFGQTIKANPHLSTVVEVYEDREHTVVTTGPYKYVRHPWYVGILLWFYSVPLCLGSLYSFIPAAALTIIILARIFIEEKTLRKDLPGYEEYLRKVKYRLIPYIW